MILGAVGLLAANAAVILGAASLTRRFATGVGSVDAILFLLIRLLLISLSVILAGLTGMLKGSVLGPVGALFLAGLLALRCHRHLRLPDVSSLPPLLLAFLGVVALRLFVQVFLFAPHLGDAVCYHLPKIAEWVRAGAFTREMGLHSHVTFPAGFELIETWWVVFLHHDVLIELAGMEFLVLAAASAVALAQYVGLTPKFSLLAGAIYVVSPGLHLSATSCLNDAAVAGLVVATAALVAWRAPVWALVMAGGLGMGVKATYLYAMPGLALLACWNRKDAAHPPAERWTPLALSVGAVAVGAFWFVRNLLWFGNPVFPVGSPGYAQDPVAVQAGPKWDSFLGNFSDLINTRIYDRAGSLGANVDDMAGWGACSFALGFLALLVGVRTEPRLRKLGLAFLGSLASCLLLCVHDPWCLKYVFFAPCVLAVSAAWICQSKPGMIPMACVGLLADFAVTMLPYDLPMRDLEKLAAQSWRERSELAIREPAMPGGPVGCFGGFTARAYSLYGPDFSRPVVYLRPESLEQLIGEMRQHHLETLYASPIGSRQSALLEEGLQSGRLRRLGKDLYQKTGE